MADVRFEVRRVALAAALVASLVPGAAQAVVTVSGNVATTPVGQPIGPGDTDLGDRGLQVGTGGVGSVRADGGSVLRTGTLLIGVAGSGNGSVVVSGAGTRLELQGDGLSYGLLNRLDLGQWGRGSLTVEAGAVLDGRANPQACLVASYCNSAIGGFAGSDATLTITGAGSQASFLRGFWVGGLHVIQPVNPYGTPGGTTHGRVNVLAGATLLSDHASLGQAPSGNPSGNERSFAEVLIRGAGSVWTVSGGTLEPADAYFNMGQHRNAWATTTIDQGGSLRVAAVDGGSRYSGVAVGNNGGRAEMVVSGAGSNITFTQQSSTMHVGRRNSVGTMDVQAGGSINNLFYLNVGREGGFGTLNIDGSGSTVGVTNTATAAANGATGAAFVDIGRQGGTGIVNVSNGARLDVTTTTATTNGIGMNLGRDAASSGTLNIGSGATVSFSAASVAPGPGEAWNPWVRVGRDGNGQLHISGGGQLLIHGGAVSSVADSRGTSLYIGGSTQTTPGGRGVASVSGAGSRISVTGSDAYVAVGIGPTAFGQLTLSNGAELDTTVMNVGRAGTGVLAVDGATINLSGQHTGSVQSHAALSIGNLDGFGAASFTNGARLNITHLAGSPTLNLGGTGPNPLGDGSLTLDGGAVVTLRGAAGRASTTVGRDGSGVLRMKGASVLDVGDGQLVVGRLGGSDGTIIATGGSTITAGWVGIGRRIDTGTGQTFDGGTATMVLNGATLNATDIVIGSNGYLGGSAGSIVASGTVTNYGIFSPGSSPGTFTIDGDYVAGTGSRLILEVQRNAGGGYDTDLVYFKQGRALDLAALNVEFRFLGNTDPEQFQRSGGFDIDTFLALQTTGGQAVEIDHALLANVEYSARADAYTFTSFEFSAEGGASFVAVPVPEPGTWVLMLAGGGMLAGLARRRRRLDRQRVEGGGSVGRAQCQGALPRH